MTYRSSPTRCQPGNAPRFWFAAWLPLLAGALAAGLAAPADARRMDSFADADEGITRTDRLIVRYRAGAGPTFARAQAALRVAGNRHGVQLAHGRSMANGAQVVQISRTMGSGDVQALAAALKSGDAGIEYAEPDLRLQTMAVPTDPMVAQQWALSDANGGIRAPAAWDRSTGRGVTVAVIDTGVRPHTDLVANLLPGHDFVADVRYSADGNGRDSDAADPGDAAAAGLCGAGSAASRSSWHGTHVAGIVAATANNGQGVVGVAHGAKLLPLRAMGRCGGYSSDIADAVVWGAGGAVAGAPANANPARVINLSLGGVGSCGTTMQNAINAARARGAVVVVSAGNSNADAARFTPANCTGVVVVTAVGRSGGKASYANTGTAVALAAPGGDSGMGVLSTLNAGTGAPGADSYASYMGTSMAAPVVSGVAALVLAANPKYTPDQVAAVLKASARAFPAACTRCGAGIVDAHAAVAQAQAAAGTTGTPVATPVTSPAPTPTPTPVPVSVPAVAQVMDKEPNNSLATAQAIASLPAKVSGTLATNSDLDYFKLQLPAKAKLNITLSAGSASGFGLVLSTATGQTVLTVPGVAGRNPQVTVSNAGSAAVPLVLRVLRSTGAAGAYQLNLAP